MQISTIPKKRYRISCVCCGRLISTDSNNRPFRVEVRKKEYEEAYDKITRCPRCQTWLGVFK